MRIAILGAGRLGGALAAGWSRAGHAIIFGVPDPAGDRYRGTAEAAGDAPIRSVAAAVEDADAVVLAVPFEAVAYVLAGAGDLAGRILIDATLPLTMASGRLELSMGFGTSGG